MYRSLVRFSVFPSFFLSFFLPSFLLIDEDEKKQIEEKGDATSRGYGMGWNKGVTFFGDGGGGWVEMGNEKGGNGMEGGSIGGEGEGEIRR